MRREPAGEFCRYGVVPCRLLLACSLVFAPAGALFSWSQTPAPVSAAESPVRATGQAGRDFQGQTVGHIIFEGVGADRLAPLSGNLPQMEGQPLSPSNVSESLRQLYATGLYDTIQAEAQQDGTGVDLIFRGTPRMFIGTVGVDGAKGPTMNAQLLRASQLSPGTRFTQAKLSSALEQMRQTMVENGFNEPVITPTLTPHPDQQLVDISFIAVSGAQARVGKVQVSGDPGMSVSDFRRYARLRAGAHVDHDTGNRALTGVLKRYQSEDRMEAEIKIVSAAYDPATKTVNYSFSAIRGPVVKVLVQGANIGPERLKRIIPVYQEGSVDEDLLNEGNRGLRDYYQQLGFFDVKVSHEQRTPSSGEVVIVFNVQLGERRRVQVVSVAGNHYFDSATLKELLGVRAADSLDHHGLYSQALVAADVAALESLYRNNGFSKIKITPETSTPETSAADNPAPAKPEPTAQRVPATAQLAVTYKIDEGDQLRVGAVRMEGNEHVEAAKLTPLLNTLRRPVTFAAEPLRRPRRTAHRIPEPRLRAGEC